MKIRRPPILPLLLLPPLAGIFPLAAQNTQTAPALYSEAWPASAPRGNPFVAGRQCIADEAPTSFTPASFAPASFSEEDSLEHATMAVTAAPFSDSPPPVSRAATNTSEARREPKPLTDLFVLVSVDGLRPDVIFPHAPTIQRLRHSGADARNSRTISKSTTLPSHASMVSGVDHDQHGLSFNSYHPERGPIRFPTIFSEAEKAGLSVRLFAGKRKLELLVTDAQKEHFQLGGVYCNRVTELAVPYLRAAEPGIVFIHFADPDGAGHTYGWLSEEYMHAVRRADRCVRELVDVIRSREDGIRITMLVTSDHGGHNHGHGSRRADDRNIPWLMWGEAVAPRTRIKRAVLNTDTAATVLHTLGLKAPADMQGTPVLEALLDS